MLPSRCASYASGITLTLMLNVMEKNSLASLEKRFGSFEERFDAMYEYMKTSFERVHQDMRAIHGRLTDVEEKDIDTEDRLTGVEKAMDAESIQLMDHQKRIRRLEKKEKKPQLAKG
jgi:septation ring formation regulator EzrA